MLQMLVTTRWLYLYEIVQQNCCIGESLIVTEGDEHENIKAGQLNDEFGFP